MLDDVPSKALGQGCPTRGPRDFSEITNIINLIAT